MKITKLFKLICLLPILVGCNQTPVPEKEQLIVVTYYFDDSNPMPEEYKPQVEKMISINGRKKPRYDVTPNELRPFFTLYASKEYPYPDVILYKGELFPTCIRAIEGIASFAYYKGNGKELIYHAAFSGSMISLVNVAAFNLKTMQDMAVDIKFNRAPFTSDDYNGLVFKSTTKDDKLQLQAYKLVTSLDLENHVEVYEEKELVHEDLLQYELVPWGEYSPND